MNPISEVYNEDCMIGMARYPDNYFELAIVDPPYGIDVNKMELGSGKYKTNKGWDNKPPPPAYFDLLNRKCKNQIIFGANHFIDNFPFMCNSSCWVVWDKNNGLSDFADCELMWTSFCSPVRKFRYNLSQQTRIDIKNRFHPTQKPIALYKWLLKNYANEGDKILDTHLGSGSSRIACWDGGFDFYGWEIDKDYFDAMEKRFNDHIQQLTLDI